MENKFIKAGDVMGDSYKPKVLLIHNFYQFPGGEDSVFFNEKKMLEDNGHEVITYTRDNEEINKFRFWEKLFYPINTVFSIKTYKEVNKIILDNQIDIVHVHNTWPLISPSVYYAAFHSNIPVVQTIHNFRMICPGATLYHDGKICEDSLNNGLRSSLKLKIYKGSFIQTLISAITLKIHRLLGTYRDVNYIFLTEFNKEKILELNNKGRTIINKRKTFIKPNFVNSVVNSEIIPFNARKNQFIFVGRLDKLKGIRLLLESWKGISESDLIICGSGPEAEWCNDYILDNGLSNVKMMGLVSNDVALHMIAESKALILPTQWYEGFPMTIVESMACGTPVIGSNIGNVGNLIEDGVTGLKFKFDSVEKLRESVKGIFDMCQTSRNHYECHYTVDGNYAILSKIYQEINEREHTN